MGKTVLIYGGQSPEHEVSLNTAKTMLAYLPDDTACVKITAGGNWIRTAGITESDEGPLFIPMLEDIDFAYLGVHGTNCEDGVLQGYLARLGIPFSGSGESTSRLCMAKQATKQAVSKICPGCDSICSSVYNPNLRIPFDPVIVKPDASGSSVGVTVLHSPTPPELKNAFDAARRHSRWVLFERFIENARELECGILDIDGTPTALPVAELKHGSFLSYEDKYLSGTDYITCPAEIDGALKTKIQSCALAIFKLLGCKAYARCDFLLDPVSGRLLFNEINTLPGLTGSSHYPRMLKAAGIGFDEFLRQIRRSSAG